MSKYREKYAKELKEHFQEKEHEIPKWRYKIAREVRAALRNLAPCLSHKHDGVHSDFSCGKCGGSLIDSRQADEAQIALDNLFTVLESDND